MRFIHQGAISLMTVISILLILGTTMDTEGQLLPPMYTTSGDPMEQFACEVLLNPDRIEYDLGPMQDLVGTGSVLYLDVDLPTIHFATEGEGGIISEETGFPPGEYYIYRSSYQNQMAVILTEVNDSGFVQELYPEVDADGLSISFVAPASLQNVNNTILKAEIPISDPMDLDSEFSFFAESLGYFVTPLRDYDNEPAGYTLISGNTTIDIFNEGPRDIDTNLSSGIIATIGTLRDQTKLNSDLGDMLENLGLNTSYLDDLELQPQIQVVMDLRTDMDISLDEIDWSELVETELRWLMKRGVIKGLSEEDISDISEDASPGLSGIQHRIMELDGTWIPVDEKLMIPYLGGQTPEDGTGSRFKFDIDDLPDPIPEIIVEEAPDLAGLLIFISVLTIYLVFMSIFLFARHSKDELLDNLNRKALFDAISMEPGIHYKALQRKLDLKQGVLSYHLNKLEKNELIKSIQDGNKRRFYMFDDKIDFQFRLHDVQESILELVCKRPGLSQTKISKRLGKNKMVVNYHLRILSDAGIVFFERDGREYQYFGTDAAQSLIASS